MWLQKKTRGCIDPLTNLKNYIREGFIKKEHIITIFFDLEKAYDTTWKFGIIKDLYDLKLRGRLPKFIKNFLTDRTFQVCIRSTLSNLKKPRRCTTRQHSINHSFQHQNKQYNKRTLT